MPRRVLIKCPSCGFEIHGLSHEIRRPSNRHPRLSEIENDIAQGFSRPALRLKYALSRSQAAGIAFRFWDKVRTKTERNSP